MIAVSSPDRSRPETDFRIVFTSTRKKKFISQKDIPIEISFAKCINIGKTLFYSVSFSPEMAMKHSIPLPSLSNIHLYNYFSRRHLLACKTTQKSWNKIDRCDETGYFCAVA